MVIISRSNWSLRWSSNIDNSPLLRRSRSNRYLYSKSLENRHLFT